MAKKTQKYVVTGNIKKGDKRKFSLEVSAESEGHASALVKTILGSKHGLRITAFEILEIKKK